MRIQAAGGRTMRRSSAGEHHHRHGLSHAGQRYPHRADGDRVRIRYRVDGVCLEKDTIPEPPAPLVTRFKILSGMDIAEKRLPQDGRIKRNIAGTDIDFRVSSLPGCMGPAWCCVSCGPTLLT